MGWRGCSPRKRGPHGGHKLTGEVIAFLGTVRTQDPTLRPPELAQRVADRFGITVHPRTIQRTLTRPEKKRSR